MARQKTAADTSQELLSELQVAMDNPRDIFGYARYGDGEKWARLDEITGGIQPNCFAVLAARPKRGKSMIAADWIPHIARQAQVVGQVVRVVTLEMTRKSYQRRVAALMAEITDPMNIRKGRLTPEEHARYVAALQELSSLPIEYLSNESDLSEDESMQTGNSAVTYKEVSRFIKARNGQPTFWWVLDHIGLLNDLDAYGDVTTSIYSLANKLATLAHITATGLVITHLNRASVGSVPSMESIAGSDQVARNADQIFLLSRPFMDSPELSDDDKEALVKNGGEPAILGFYSRDEGSGSAILSWRYNLAAFRELPVDEGVRLPMPSKHGKR